MTGIIVALYSMAHIHNSDTIRRILNDAGIQTSSEDPPTELAGKVVPVLISNPDRLLNPIFKVGSASTTGASVIYTTPTTQDFYLTYVNIGYTCDVLCDSTAYYLKVYPKGHAETILITLLKETLVLGHDSITLSLAHPILLKKGSAVSIIQTFGAGDSTMLCTIGGYVV